MLPISNGVACLVLIFGLLVVPRALQRFRIPAPLTSFALGMAAAILAAGFRAGNRCLPLTWQVASLLASFFIAFHFFHAGMTVPVGAIQWESLGLGVVLAAAVLPFPIGSPCSQRRVLMGEDAVVGPRVAVAPVPALVSRWCLRRCCVSATVSPARCSGRFP